MLLLSTQKRFVQFLCCGVLNHFGHFWPFLTIGSEIVMRLKSIVISKQVDSYDCRHSFGIRDTEFHMNSLDDRLLIDIILVTYQTQITLRY